MKLTHIAGVLLLGAATVSTFAYCTSDAKKTDGKTAKSAKTDSTQVEQETPRTPVDTAKYNELVAKLANGDTTGKWPVKNQPYPLAGAIQIGRAHV